MSRETRKKRKVLFFKETIFRRLFGGSFFIVYRNLLSIHTIKVINITTTTVVRNEPKFSVK